jgi:hypothetical protein
VVIEPGIQRCEGPYVERVTPTPVSPSAVVFSNFTTTFVSFATEVAGGSSPLAPTPRPLYLHVIPSATVLSSTVTASSSASETPHAQPLHHVFDAGAFTTASTRVTGAFFGPFLGHTLQFVLRRLQPGWDTAGRALKFGFGFQVALLNDRSANGSTASSKCYPCSRP